MGIIDETRYRNIISTVVYMTITVLLLIFLYLDFR
nr:MAG TPA: hypothetical protein [Crassvirales sp.]